MNRFAWFVILAVALPAAGHHSTAEFDFAATTELDGEVAEVFWRNPHVQLTLRTSDVQGVEQVWDLEAQDVNSLGRRGLGADTIQVGDRVKVAGNPSRRNARSLFVTNLLLPSGTEVRLRGEATAPRWSTATAGFAAPTRADARPDALAARGVFRVWLRSGGPGPGLADMPLTSSAQAAVARWTPSDDSSLRCIGAGMPAAMTIGGQIHPIEIVERDGDIVVRIETFDRVRRIRMSEGAAAAAEPGTPLGFSVGRFEGETLVVRTTRIEGGQLDGDGRVPLSAAVVVDERFTPLAATDQLVYERTVTDPATLTEPFSARWIYDWRPELVVEPFECTVGE
jgi:hypothetical protein